MPVFPFFRYPYFNNYYRYNNLYNHNGNRINNNFSEYKNTHNNSNSKVNNINDKNKIDLPEPEIDDNSDSEQIFEIFGIKLYFDDVLIISLLILLYNEGVKDYSLFISLILLLIS